MKIAIIGAGEMGGAFASGLLKGSMFKHEDITVSNPHANKLARFEKLGASVTTDNKVAISGADFITNVVKTVADELKGVVDYDKQTILNMAASVSIAQLSQWLEKDGKAPAIVQALPNIGIAEQASMTFLSHDSHSEKVLGSVEAIFASVGSTLVVDEPLLSYGRALSGCGTWL